MFAGINMFWTRLRLTARAKMSSEKGPKYIYAQEHKLFYYYYHFGGHWGNKHWKNDNKTLWRIFFSPVLWENVNKLWNGFSILIGFLDRTIIWFSLFIGLLNSILARKMHHSARQSDNNESLALRLCLFVPWTIESRLLTGQCDFLLTGRQWFWQRE